MSSAPDFHVVSLRYSLQPNDRVAYISPPPVEFETGKVRVRLADGEMTCDMKTHFPTAEAARAAIEPLLRAWEASADLRLNRGELRFKFNGAQIVDRRPPPPGGISAHLIASPPTLSACLIGSSPTVHATRDHYPEPPGPFRLTPDAESLLVRYQGYLGGREPLLSMAYFCLTLIEALGGGAVRSGRRQRAAKVYKVKEQVLKCMGELTTRRGDRSSARKAYAEPVQQLTGNETAWLEAAVKLLIWRLGDTRESTTLPLITMSDLPPL